MTPVLKFFDYGALANRHVYIKFHQYLIDKALLDYDDCVTIADDIPKTEHVATEYRLNIKFNYRSVKTGEPIQVKFELSNPIQKDESTIMFNTSISLNSRHNTITNHGSIDVNIDDEGCISNIPEIIDGVKYFDILARLAEGK